MRNKADVVVVGGGINGCSLAYQLAKRGVDVVLLEREYLTSGATGRSGAGIRQQWSTRGNTELAIKSVKIFESLEKELGQDIGLRQGGYLIAVHDKKEMKQAEKNVKMQRSLGLEVFILAPDQINDVVSILDVQRMNVVGATFCSTDGHADPFKTTFAYANAARNNGAGAWSKKIAGMAGIKIPNVPFRKEILATERLKPLFEAMVISFKDGIYFSQLEDGQIIGGMPIPEEKHGYKMMLTFSFIQHMSRTLTRYAPVLKHINVLRHWTGFYDVTPDSRPILGEDEKVSGFIHCHGFSGHGFMISPMVTKVLTDYIADGKVSPILEGLKLSRFKGKKLEYETSVVG